jgi:hypothetical protein
MIEAGLSPRMFTLCALYGMISRIERDKYCLEIPPFRLIANIVSPPEGILPDSYPAISNSVSLHPKYAIKMPSTPSS